MDISGYNEKAKLFFVRKMDWGLTCRPRHEDKWTVYANGHVDADRETFSFNMRNAFSDEDFKNFCTLLDEFPQIEDDLNGCDGTGYEMILYDKKGNVIHKFCGYIYGNLCLEILMRYLNKF